MTTQKSASKSALDIMQAGLNVAVHEGIPCGKPKNNLEAYIKARMHSSEVVKAAKMFRIMGYSVPQIVQLINGTNPDKKVTAKNVYAWVAKNSTVRNTDPEDCLTKDEVRAALEQSVPNTEHYSRLVHARSRDITGRFVQEQGE
ncbi:hypothetical protein EXU30_19695 [Shewanella maritima]|uniref:Uncharacterized protein n=1 Tax=Shewanella maritima TaxID=2520507 RepID=A0A411PMC3_9GAMM|nr:hypothetical protein [Shewanella maritima]QBF84649.1 hypothetical protein EXU30_19695 [Shewanella maritima]